MLPCSETWVAGLSENHSMIPFNCDCSKVKSSFRYRHERLGHVGHGEGHRDVDNGSHQADQEAVQTCDEIPLMEIFLETLNEIYIHKTNIHSNMPNA